MNDVKKFCFTATLNYELSPARVLWCSTSIYTLLTLATSISTKYFVKR